MVLRVVVDVPSSVMHTIHIGSRETNIIASRNDDDDVGGGSRANIKDLRFE